MLLDPKSSLSYVTLLVAMNFKMSPKKIPEPFLVSTLVGESVVAKQVYRDYPITILHRVILFDLIEVDMVDFDLTLGIDWLHSCYASIDYSSRVVKFHFPDEPIFEWSGSPVSPKSHFISYLKAKKLISKGFIYHLVRVKDTKSEAPTI